MATSQTKPQSGIPWHKASTFILLLISLGTIAYTVLVTKELAASIAHLKKEVTRLESDCTQQSGNTLHAHEHTTIRRLLSGRRIRSINANAQLWKMLQTLTAKSNNTVILSLLIRDGMRIHGTIGLPGPRGKPGPIGPKGARGDRGIIGVRGEKGDKGSIGQKGAKGEHGTKGAKGDSISEPQIVIPPGDQKVLEKSTATFSCYGVGYPIPNVTIMPTNKTVDSRYKTIGEGMLQITNVTAKDEGEIQCIAKSVLGEDRRKAKLTVLVKAKADIPEKNIEGEEGYDVTITCNVKGAPMPTIRWYRTPLSLPRNVEYRKMKKTLLIKNAKRGDSGNYVCNADNYLRNSTDVANLQIRKRLSFFVKSPRTINSIKSENVSIYCAHENGAKPVNIKWLKDDKKLPNKAVLSKNNQVLTISNIYTGDQGSYKCIVRSKFSTLRHVTRIFVIPKTCNDIRRSGKRQSGTYTIYPLNILGPVQVFCDMTSMNNKGITVISHDSEVTTLVNGFEDYGSYRKRITYNIPMQIIKAIIAESNTCEQFIIYECYGSMIFSGNTPYAWWISSSGQKMTNWGGVDHTKTGCSCSLRNACYTKNKKMQL